MDCFVDLVVGLFVGDVSLTWLLVCISIVGFDLGVGFPSEGLFRCGWFLE